MLAKKKNQSKTIQEALEKILAKKAKRSCSTCGPRAVKGGICVVCGSDDLPFYVPEVGESWFLSELFGDFLASIGLESIAEDELEEEAEKSFCEILDQEEPIEIGYGTYRRSKILKECDPIAFRIGVSEVLGGGTFSIESTNNVEDLEGVKFVEIGSSYWMAKDILEILDK